MRPATRRWAREYWYFQVCTVMSILCALGCIGLVWSSRWWLWPLLMLNSYMFGWAGDNWYAQREEQLMKEEKQDAR